MYGFVTHTWNTVKGNCPHSCGYCYQKAINRRFKKECPPYFDEKELLTNLGSGKFIFVGSGNDLFAQDIPADWILRTLEHCRRFGNNYLFQSKNPKRFFEFAKEIPDESTLVTTIETNRYYVQPMGNAPSPYMRAGAIVGKWANHMITIEPIMDFDLQEFVEMIKMCNPQQVNIGADSGRNGLPEPPAEKVLQLIAGLEKFTKVVQKSNLQRILKNK